ncbi:Na+_driven multidrug efflux pump [Hexamita inflata]|uniref:Na+_driven multidrug efflux pump n=1 Tax=Hexamita inflata TaxID=28002 RepID=A0ABP1HC84_9EUKA
MVTKKGIVGGSVADGGSDSIICEVAAVQNFSFQESNSNSEAIAEAQQRFSTKSPLKTILQMSIGPLLSEFLCAAYTFGDQLYVSNQSQEQLAGISSVGVLEEFAPAIGWLFVVGLTSQISSYLASGQLLLAKYVIIWSLIASIILTIVYSVTSLHYLQPILSILGSVDNVAVEATKYITPRIQFAFIPVISYTFTGVAMGLGQVKLYVIMTLIPFVISICVLDPVFILVMKLGVRGASYSYLIGQSISACIFIVYYAFFDKVCRPLAFIRKFVLPTTQRPPLRKQLLKELWLTFSIGVSDFIGTLSSVFATGVCYSKLSILAQQLNLYTEISALWGVSLRIFAIMNALTCGINAGSISCLSYAVSSQNKVRLFQITRLNFVICFILTLIFFIICELFGKYVFLLFGFNLNDEIISLGQYMLQMIMLGALVSSVNYCSTTLCQCYDLVFRGFLIAFFTQLILLPGSFFAVYYLFSSEDLMGHLKVTFFAFPLNDVLGAVFGFFLVLKALKKIKKDAE